MTKPRVQSPAVFRYAERYGVDLAHVQPSGAGGRISMVDVRNARAAQTREAGDGPSRESASAPYVTPLVAALAAAHGVDLAGVEGTGAGGRIRKDDVLRAAGIAPRTQAAADGNAQIREVIDTLRGKARSVSMTSRGGAYARNPLVDTVRAQARARGRRSPSAPAPALFAGGDLPAFTASGIPPETLLDVPWQARHAMATATTPAAAYEIHAACTGPDAAETARGFANHPGNEEYADRVNRWRMSSLTDDELRLEQPIGWQDELDRREAARFPMDAPSADVWSDDEADALGARCGVLRKGELR